MFTLFSDGHINHVQFQVADGSHAAVLELDDELAVNVSGFYSKFLSVDDVPELPSIVIFPVEISEWCLLDWLHWFSLGWHPNHFESGWIMGQLVFNQVSDKL